MEHQLEIISNCYGAHCFTAAVLLLYCYLQLLYCCFTAALLLLYCCFTAGACERIVRSNVPAAYSRHTSRFLSMW